MKAPTAASLRTAARRSCTSFVLAASLVPACSTTSSSQALRTCVDRWNQSNMVSWGPAPAYVAFRRPFAKERESLQLSPVNRCIVSIPAGDGSWTCVRGSSGAYWCPPLHEPTGPPLRYRNATIDRIGVLRLGEPLQGTHATPPLAWQRYPHVEGYVEPWTSRGTLRRGLRFDGEARGPCYIAEEAAITGIRCQNLTAGRGSDACFPQRPIWRAGDLAACALDVGATRFLQSTITDGAARDPALLVPWRRVGDIALGAPRARIDREYGPYHMTQRYGDRVEGFYDAYSNAGRLLVTYYGRRVGEIGFDTPYYRTASGFGVRSRMPHGRRWHFVLNAWSKGSPCNCWVRVGTGSRSLRATPANFLKPWFFIYTYRGRVMRFYFASKFVD